MFAFSVKCRNQKKVILITSYTWLPFEWLNISKSSLIVCWLVKRIITKKNQSSIVNSSREIHISPHIIFYVQTDEDFRLESSIATKNIPYKINYLAWAKVRIAQGSSNCTDSVKILYINLNRIIDVQNQNWIKHIHILFFNLTFVKINFLVKSYFSNKNHF